MPAPGLSVRLDTLPDPLEDCLEPALGALAATGAQALETRA